MSGVAAASIVVLALISAGAIAGGASHYAVTLGGVALPWLALVAAFAMQWIAFVPAYMQQSERFYDLVGSATYLVVVAIALLGGEGDRRALLLAALISIWAVRLGSFLFRRIRRDGRDSRFDEIKVSAPRFFVAWTLQGLWVFLTASAAIAAMATTGAAPLGALDLLGAGLWFVGFGIEVIADRQKSAFRADNPGRFVDRGLWRWSRHPNYFGEVLLWVGVAVIAASTLQGWQWVTLVSPMFVLFLLTKVSGLPQLEQSADERWGDEPAYHAYKSQTPILVPRPPRTRSVP